MTRACFPVLSLVDQSAPAERYLEDGSFSVGVKSVGRADAEGIVALRPRYRRGGPFLLCDYLPFPSDCERRLGSASVHQHLYPPPEVRGWKGR